MSRGWQLIACFGFSVLAVSAQFRVHAGLTAGVPVTDTLSSYSSELSSDGMLSFNRLHSGTKRLVIGPSVRLDLANGLGLEFNALYQRVDTDADTLTASPQVSYFFQSFSATQADRWQFPLFVEYSHSLFGLKPFVQVGPSITTIANSGGSFRSTATFNGVTSTDSNSSSGGRNTAAGLSSGLGLDLPIWRAHLRPEFRYSHWFDPSSVGTGLRSGDFSEGSSLQWFLPGYPTSASSRLQPNEASLLLSLSF